MLKDQGYVVTEYGVRKRYGFGKWFVYGLVVVAMMVVVAGVTLYTLIRSEPAGYREHKAYFEETSVVERSEMIDDLKEKMNAVFQKDLRDTKNVVLETVEQVASKQDARVDEQVVMSDRQSVKELDQILNREETAEVENIAPEDKRVNRVERIKMSQRQLNLLMEEQLDGWLDTRGLKMPEEVEHPMLNVSADRLAITFEYVDDHVSQNFTVHLNYKLTPRGVAVLELLSVDAGRLPVPAKKATKYAKGRAGDYEEHLRKVERWLEELRYMEIKPVLEIENRRRARIENVKVVNGGVELSFRVQDHQTYRETNQQMASR
ncbi:hypothetical protein JD969_06820 [Planctomycetota bacterium]|nr:hypothetical protein JD969_06820 [Planctomycetota bacterium]